MDALRQGLHNETASSEAIDELRKVNISIAELVALKGTAEKGKAGEGLKEKLKAHLDHDFRDIERKYSQARNAKEKLMSELGYFNDSVLRARSGTQSGSAELKELEI